MKWRWKGYVYEITIIKTFYIKKTKHIGFPSDDTQLRPQYPTIFHVWIPLCVEDGYQKKMDLMDTIIEYVFEPKKSNCKYCKKAWKIRESKKIKNERI